MSNEIFAPGRIPCVQWMCLNVLTQKYRIFSLSCDRVIFSPYSLLWRDIKKLLEIQDLVAGYNSFLTEVKMTWMVSLFAWFANACSLPLHHLSTVHTS